MGDRYLFRGFHPCEDGTESVWTCGKERKGRWVQGNNIIFADAKKGKRAFIVPKGEYIDDVQTKDNRLILIMPQVEVFPETVGQYTGLTDENGTKIFEGDIVNVKARAGGFKKMLIEWDECNLSWLMAGKGGAKYHIHNYWEFEALGSIHANPDILGG